MLTNQQIQSMDVHILLSIVNMKLRNDFTSLPRLCQSFELNQTLLESKLNKAHYAYQASLNQFR
ncbi:MAG: DUF4250 domain-containing protein [Paraglaciecola sp.]|uniref:DUF4250 domain-containing protein n=1 Tax=Pseudomonadati TaxID=3379134 RepID=UPI00273F4D4D|nr:DUF4250 domain-containing protein [Paraglaciecola sp.]MDP5030702.1 DUF4250 domain-containing protein [Paraglaciecola sp.]MDP5133267.1 DUF4250 domain-containing protein [Paraglaciecola sp.]